MKKLTLSLMLLAAGSAMHVSADTHAVQTVNAVKAQPENVTNLAAVTEKYIAVLSWTPVEGADNYWIYRNLMGQPLASLDTVTQGDWPCYQAFECAPPKKN